MEPIDGVGAREMVHGGAGGNAGSNSFRLGVLWFLDIDNQASPG